MMTTTRIVPLVAGLVWMVITITTSSSSALATFVGGGGSCRTRRFVVASTRGAIYKQLIYRRSTKHQSRSWRHYILLHAKKSSNDDGDDDEDVDVEEGMGAGDAGMAGAFRQLDALSSLGDDVKTTSPPSSSSSEATGFVDAPTADTPSVETASPEKEAAMYSDMVEELERTGQQELYSDVLEEMGGAKVTSGSSKAADDDKKPPRRPEQPATTFSVLEEESSSSPASSTDTEEFMNRALKEALEEVKLKDPSAFSGGGGKNVLDDKELMKEIEKIFDRGSDKLMESLEEIRREQRDLASQSSSRTADDAADKLKDGADRLVRAESSMTKMLDKVKEETAAVEQATRDLQRAEAEMDDDFLVKLKKGGLPKTAALAGFLLFSARSILDSATAMTTNDDSLLPMALGQGAIALVCAAVFFLL